MAAVVGLLSKPSTYEATRVHHGYRQAVVVSAGRLCVSEFAAILAPLHPVRESWVSWIEPGGFVVDHIDAGPHYERWQIPLSESGTLMHGDEPVVHEVGVPFRVHHDRWHRVVNDDDAPRVSLVVDRDIPVDLSPSAFRVRGGLMTSGNREGV